MKKYCLLLLIIFCTGLQVFGQSNERRFISFDFVDQQIREILYAFSTYSRISIIGDDTITGIANFQYYGSNFEQAFDSFLIANRLFVEKTENVWIVSRINIIVNPNGRIILNSYDATPMQILDKLSRQTNTTILRDLLPTSRLSLHIDASNPQEAVELIMRPFSDYTVEIAPNYIQIKRSQAEHLSPMFPANTGFINVYEYNNKYAIEIEQARVGDVIDQLFQTANREYVSFIRADQIINRARFSDKNFTETLTIILEQGGGEYIEIGNLFYLFPVQQADIVTNLRNTGKSWERFETKYQLVSEIIPHLQARFGNLQVITLSDNNTFLSLVDIETAIDIRDFIQTIDIPYRSEPIRLRFIRTEDLYRSLPPSVGRENIIDAGNNTIFFTGSDERKTLFLKDLETIDRPQPRIRYDIFIIQVQDSTNLNWSFQAEMRSLRPGDRTMVTGQLGNLLNLNFDIITIFGYQFAARLNAAIADNQASVFADTTLFGLSGEEIKFQNTSTYRYRDSNIDPETGRPLYTGVTREIVSGLLLEIQGWVSGDGMITTSVTASISRRGADVSSSTGNPPPTSERLLTTQVRGRSGEIVVLSGLRQNDTTLVERRTPGISRIPVLGWLFRNRNNTAENTQMIIYLVPHVDLANDEYSIDGLRTSSIFSRFVEPYLDDL